MAHAHDPTTRVRSEERRADEGPAYARHEHVSPAATLASTLTRLIYAVFGALELLLLMRFVLKLGNANPANAIVATLYAIAEPFVAPFVGIFPTPTGAVIVEIAALLAIAFLVLFEALLVALVRAASGTRANRRTALRAHGARRSGSRALTEVRRRRRGRAPPRFARS